MRFGLLTAMFFIWSTATSHAQVIYENRADFFNDLSIKIYNLNGGYRLGFREQVGRQMFVTRSERAGNGVPNKNGGELNIHFAGEMMRAVQAIGTNSKHPNKQTIERALEILLRQEEPIVFNFGCIARTPDDKGSSSFVEFEIFLGDLPLYPRSVMICNPTPRKGEPIVGSYDVWVNGLPLPSNPVYFLDFRKSYGGVCIKCCPLEECRTITHDLTKPRGNRFPCN